MTWRFGRIPQELHQDLAGDLCPPTLNTQTSDGSQNGPAKQEDADENEVDALTFMQTVIMSFLRGMTHGEQTLSTNDLFVHLSVQLLLP